MLVRSLASRNIEDVKDIDAQGMEDSGNSFGIPIGFVQGCD